MRRARGAWAYLAAACAASAALVGFTGRTDAQTAPTVTAEPATDLVDGTEVTVTVAGVVEGTFVQIGQCRADGTSFWEDCADSSEAVSADETGTVTLLTRVDAVIRTYGDEEELVTTDCRDGPTCVLGVMLDESGQLDAQVDLAFTPDGPLAPPPTAEAAPTEGLTDGQPVTITGAGFVWSTDAVIMQCREGFEDISSDCDDGPLGVVEVDATGSFETTVRVLSVIEVWGEEGLEPLDCRPPNACVVAVGHENPFTAERTTTIPIAFDPDAEPLMPTVEVTPDQDLVDGQEVTVSGEDFVHSDGLVLLCVSEEISWETCQSAGVFEAAADGSFQTTATVRALLETWSSAADCRAADSPCTLVVTRRSDGSLRSAQADLHFDPEGPVPAGPELTVEPSTDLPEDATVTVTGRGFTPLGFVRTRVCQVGSGSACAESARFLEADATGGFTTQLAVSVDLAPVEGDPVDCREAPGCEVVAFDQTQGRSGRAALSFAPPPVPGDERYVDPVFDEVEVTEEIVYRETTDHTGAPVQLALDVYEPAGDTAAKRPAVLLVHGGWFGEGDRGDMALYAEDFAQRGYVAVSVDYRMRSDFFCCPGTDAAGITDALLDSYEDVRAGVDWLRSHSSEYRIDPDVVVAGGADAGAAASWHLAQLSGQMGQGGGPAVAAALPIGGVHLGRPDAGEAPVIAFHWERDSTAPAHLSESSCGRSVGLGIPCEVVKYPSTGSSLAAAKRRDVVRRSVEFLANNVLAQKGYVDRPLPQPPTSPTTTSPTTVAAGGPSSSDSRLQGGSLPRTGTDTTLLLIRIGLILIAAGVAIVALARQKGKKAEIAIFAVMALTLGAVAGAFVLSSEDDDETELTSPAADEDHSDHRDHDEDDHDVEAGREHDDEDEHEDGAEHDDGDGHDDGDEHDDGHDDDGHDDDHDDGPGRPGSGSGHGHGSGEGHDNNDGHHDGGDPDPGHPHDPQDPGHPPGDPGHHPPGDPGHPPGDPGHPPGDPGHPDPPVDEPGFPDWWGPEEEAKGWKLIDDTTAALRVYENRGLLPLLGYVWIADGIEVDGYQHWVSTGRIWDSHPPLTPASPESLVFRNDREDGPVLEAAMYMLSLEYYNPGSDPLAKVPQELLYLPGWHIHDNLCFADGLQLVGIAPCPPGSSIIPTPPMMHVWTVPTPCGRFAGVDEHGLQCEPHHHP